MHETTYTVDDYLWCNALMELLKRNLKEKHNDIRCTIDNIIKRRDKDCSPNCKLGAMTEKGDHKVNQISHTDFVKTLNVLKTKVDETFSGLAGSDFNEMEPLLEKIQRLLSRKDKKEVREEECKKGDLEIKMDLSNIDLLIDNEINIDQLNNLTIENDINSHFIVNNHHKKKSINKIPRSFQMEIEGVNPKRVVGPAENIFCNDNLETCESNHEIQCPNNAIKSRLIDNAETSDKEANLRVTAELSPIKSKVVKKPLRERKTLKPTKDIVNTMTEEYKRMALALQEKKKIKTGRSIDKDSDELDPSDDSLQNLEKFLIGKTHLLGKGGHFCDTKLLKGQTLEESDKDVKRVVEKKKKKKSKSKKSNDVPLKSLKKDRITWSQVWWEDIEEPKEVNCDYCLKKVQYGKSPYIRSFEVLKNTGEGEGNSKPTPEKSIDCGFRPFRSSNGKGTPQIQELFDVSEDESDDDYFNSKWARI